MKKLILLLVTALCLSAQTASTQAFLMAGPVGLCSFFNVGGCSTGAQSMYMLFIKPTNPETTAFNYTITGLLPDGELYTKTGSVHRYAGNGYTVATVNVGALLQYKTIHLEIEEIQ